MSARFREMDQRSPVTVVYTDEQCTSTNVVNNPGGIVGFWNRTWDERTPRFHERIKKGEIITNPYHNIKEMRTNSINGIIARSNNMCPGGVKPTLTQTREGPQLTYMLEQHPSYGRLQPYWLLDQDTVSRVAGIAATKCWSAAQSNDSQLLVTTAELNKTLKLLTNPLGNVKLLIKKIERQKNASRATRSLTLGKYLSSEWLSYRYGFRPLMLDIEQTLQALSRPQKKGWTRSKGSSSIEQVQTTPFVFPHGDIDTSWSLFHKHVYTAYCGFLYDANLTTQDYLGVNIRSIPGSAWELIPYSFVVDWFANVGTYIEGLTAFVSRRTAGAYTIHKHEITLMRIAHGSVVARNPTASTLVRGMSGVETLTSISKDRVLGVAAPSLRAKFDISSVPLDLRLFDSVGLILQKLRS